MTRRIELWYNNKKGMRGYSFFDTIPQAKKKMKELNKTRNGLSSVIHVQYFDTSGQIIEDKSIIYYLDNCKFKSI